MKIHRSHAPETAEALTLLTRPTKLRVVRPEGPDVLGVARCPRCGFEMVARMTGRRPTLWCRCAARAPLPACA